MFPDRFLQDAMWFINETDVALAMASDALLISFNTSVTKEAKQKAKDAEAFAEASENPPIEEAYDHVLV